MTELWFYKGPGNWFDKVIRWYDKSKGGTGLYSHVEVIVNGTSYSANSWDNAVTKNDVSWYNKDHWDTVPVTLAKDEAWLNKQVGKKYDWLGLCGFILFKLQDSKRWFCSELAAAALGYNITFLSPGELSAIIIGKM